METMLNDIADELLEQVIVIVLPDVGKEKDQERVEAEPR
jgi:hypothetical protein